MSKSAPTYACNPLEPGVSLGLSFKADDGSFLCQVQKEVGFVHIGFVKNRNPGCQFLVENLCNGKVQIKDSNGSYLRRTDRGGRFPIEAKQIVPDKSCEFKLFTRNGKVIFQGDNGLFLSRIYSGLYSGANTLESVKKEADECCEFLPEGQTSVMSKSVPTYACHLLEPGVSLGLSFKADDGSFLCQVQKEVGFVHIGFVKNRNPGCQFLVENLCNGKVQIKDSNGSYLRRTDRYGRFPIEAKQIVPDKSCEFKLFTRNGKVIFQGDNGLFLSRIDSGLYSGANTLESAKKEADEFCEFLPEGFVNTCEN